MEQFPRNDYPKEAEEALIKNTAGQSFEEKYSTYTDWQTHNNEYTAISERLNEIKKLVPINKQVEQDLEDERKELERRQQELIDRSALFPDQVKNKNWN